MKAFVLLVLGALLGGTTHAQTTPPAATPGPQQAQAVRQKTADRRAATYQGPKVVKDSKKLGREMLRDSKPAPAPVVAPVRQ